ncbi:receptor-like protein 7 [Fagus crenata]
MRIPLLSWLFFLPICSLLLSFGIFVVSGQCIVDQRGLLIELKKSLKFNSTLSTKLVHWNETSLDCCSWQGVNCSDGGRVIGLNLKNESISGGLDHSSSLFRLQYLQSLSLAYNNFNSPIPPEFGNLTNLIYLNLSTAGFAEQIPIEISRLTRLVTLDLSTDFYLSISMLKLANLATLVQNLSELQELYLDGVIISAQGNEWCQALSSSLPNLRVLSMSECYLSGPLHSSLHKLQSLSIIRLSYNNLSTPVPEFFANFTNLTNLHLSSCGLNGKFPEKIFQVPTLQTLDLIENELLNGSLPEFHPNGSLRSLLLSCTNFSGALPDSIGNLKMLSKIDLSSCNFSGSIPSSMENLTQLIYLDLSSNKFNRSVPPFSMAKNLTQINLSFNSLTGQITSTHWKDLPNLVNLDLRSNSLNGSIPVSLFSLPSLQKLQLSNNRFSGLLNEFSNVFSSAMDTLDLSSNNLEGPIPTSVFELRGLKILLLSSNNFSGCFQLNKIQQLRNLSKLDLSYNSLLIDEYNGTNSSLPPIPQITTVKLASCKLNKIPDFLRNQSKLAILDLSNNQIHGKISNWIWNLTNRLNLNLSYNFLSGPLLNLPSALVILDISSNLLEGQLPALPPSAIYLDFSRNNFTSVIPAGISLTGAFFLSLSNNQLFGRIPLSTCNATYLVVLDLSDNLLNGTIPQCLNETLGVLDVRRNRLSGTISDKFPVSCGLQTLNLNGNLLEGGVPKSLNNCKNLEVLDMRNNQIKDTFPCYLKNISDLRVLILRSNRFYGSIDDCGGPNTPWPMLQIVDLALNNFSELEPLYYQDVITVTSKGLDIKLVKILTLFTLIDFSHNNLDGLIPEEFGKLKSLHGLNLSHNALTGQIPPSLGNLTTLESVDLSSDKLTGEIPMHLVDLTFLAVLDLSFNQLVGSIPQGKQFNTFENDSYEGNKGLCGSPMTAKCQSDKAPPPSAFEETHSNSGIVIGWNFISAELGFIFGFGIVIGPLMFWKRWRIWYCKHVDDILFSTYPRLYLGKEYCGRRAHRNKARRH